MPMQDIVFEIGGMRFRSGLVDENGRVASRVAFDSPTRPEEVVEHIQRIVESYAVSAPNAAVGIAIGGIVEKNGLVTSGTINMSEYPLAEKLALTRPVAVINDAKAAALAEAVYNPRLAGESSFVLMTISTGIGGGVVLNGELYEGETGTAGEVGHMIIDNGQDLYCRLGHRGCLDALASGRALDNRLRKLWREGHWNQHGNGIGIQDLPSLLANNDGMAQRLIRETGQWIGAGVMSIIRVLDPCEIIFKGYLVTELWPYLQPHIANVIRGYERTVPMSLTSLGDNAGLVGAGIAIRRRQQSSNV
ncbi:MAG TPA: ROK family protein [Armatimonadota bacterium]|nr:ROK family protein [Armatimonadota bacterium]